MARVNFEDDVESQNEFWKLLPLVGGDRIKALGTLVLFFRIAQKAYGYDQPMTAEQLCEAGLECVIKSGWAVEVPGGFHSLGAEKHFGWYRQKVEFSRKGGQANKAKIKQNSASLEAPSQLAYRLPPASPLSPSLSPSLFRDFSSLEEKSRERESKKTSPNALLPPTSFSSSGGSAPEPPKQPSRTPIITRPVEQWEFIKEPIWDRLQKTDLGYSRQFFEDQWAALLAYDAGRPYSNRSGGAWSWLTGNIARSTWKKRLAKAAAPPFDLNNPPLDVLFEAARNMLSDETKN